MIVAASKLLPFRLPGRWGVLAVGAAFLALGVPNASAASAKTDILTHHYNSMRTGWNSTETTLTPSNVATSFGPIATAALDDEVDAQPLLATSQTIRNATTGVTGVEDVLYVVTEGNTIYALDANTGKQIASRNLGAPVPTSAGTCHYDANNHNTGIAPTPVLDRSTGTMYLVADTYEGSPATPVYRIHAINMTTLQDRVTPVVVSASDTLTNGVTYTFNATHERERPALLLANGTIYAGFGSYCDGHYALTRGWLLGWKSGTLTPLAAKMLTNRLGSAPMSKFLTSIWMSGAGPAVDASGNVYVVTGNSDAKGTSWNPENDLSESVLKVAPTLSDVLDYFTPSDNAANPAGTGLIALEEGDNDLGGGGITLVPDQPGSTPHLALAGGKSGYLYLLNRDNLGEYNKNGANRVLGTYYMGNCWCQATYYVGSDGVARVVTSGQRQAKTWKLETSGSAHLVAEYSTANLQTGQNSSFFTAVSSNGNTGAIVWAVGKPTSTAEGHLTLMALDPAQKLKLIYSASAGPWTYTAGNAFTVPVVANGKVYVAANKTLTIFGLDKE